MSIKFEQLSPNEFSFETKQLINQNLRRMPKRLLDVSIENNKEFTNQYLRQKMTKKKYESPIFQPRQQNN